MTEEEKQKIIEHNRNFIKGYEEEIESDQKKMLPQPPLVKAQMRGDGEKIALPRDFSVLKLNNDILSVINGRHSSRVFTEEKMSLNELSFLLWATQGVKEIRGRAYATLRTVPSAGARHPFETYLAVKNIDGLKAGKYHYLPMEHALEYLGEIEDSDKTVSDSLCGQEWAAKANAVFYWSIVPYRAEWRYDVYSHRVALIDAGHLCENLYIAVTSLGMGGCAVGALEPDMCDELFELDGFDEFMFYSMPVGKISEEDKAVEKSFYKFVEEQNL